MYVCMYINISNCILIYTCNCVYVCIYVQDLKFMYLCCAMYVCMTSVSIHQRMLHVCMYVCMYNGATTVCVGTFTGFFLNLGLVVGATLGLYIDSTMLGRT